VSELTVEEQLEAQSLKDEIDQIAEGIANGERDLNTSWVKLGSRVHKVRSKKYWKTYGAHSFGAYVLSLEPKIQKKRSQVYVCVGVIETLGSQLSDEQLEEMGITRASVLKKYVQISGKIVPQTLIDAALDRTKDIDQFRADVSSELHEVPQEKGSWWELGGFFVTPEEKILIKDTIEMVKQVDPPIPHDIPEHEQNKLTFLRLCMEFRSTYGGIE